jgi:hypothetical protein
MTVSILETDIYLHDGLVPSISPPAGALSIVVLHEPVDPDKLKDHYHLALTGHLHGYQFVF